MLAYTTGTSLHALTYQGDVDVTLEQGVTDLYDPRRSEGWYWLR